KRPSGDIVKHAVGEDGIRFKDIMNNTIILLISRDYITGAGLKCVFLTLNIPVHLINLQLMLKQQVSKFMRKPWIFPIATHIGTYGLTGGLLQRSLEKIFLILQ